MRVGVEQRHGDRLRAGERDLLHERARAGAIERPLGSLGAGALGRGEAKLRGHERRWAGGAQVVELGAVLARELDHVGEALCGDQGGAGGAILEQRVRGDGHAVGEALDHPRLRAGAREHQADRVEHADRLLGWGGGDLGGVQR